tara:strand:- start:6 stop:461 length:456 start_codon:yes stop_codon:yes gene_type:complete
MWLSLLREELKKLKGKLNMKILILVLSFIGLSSWAIASEKAAQLEKLGYSTTKVIVPTDVNIGEVNDKNKPKLETTPKYFEAKEVKDKKLTVKVRPTKYCNDASGQCGAESLSEQNINNVNQVTNINRNIGHTINNDVNSKGSVGVHIDAH